MNKHAPKLNKVILYYGFTPVADPEAIRLWQKQLCESYNLKGRILISKHGINGTVGGEMADVKKYVRETRKYEGFKKIVFKWSDGRGDEFPRLRVVVKDELVSFGNPDEIQVDENGVIVRCGRRPPLVCCCQCPGCLARWPRVRGVAKGGVRR